MTQHFLNYESALYAIEEHTKQTCNSFTVLHYITNGYLNLYFHYTGELYRKLYKSIVSEEFEENDFTITSTDKVINSFLRIKLSSLDNKKLYQVFNENEKLKVGNVHTLRSTETYHLLQDNYHINVDFYDEDLFNTYIDMLLENEELPDNLLMMDSKGRELTQFNRYEFLDLNDLYFSSEEIEELVIGIKQDHRSNLYTNRDRDLANQVLIQFFAQQLLKRKPELSKMKQAKIIESVMKDIKRPMSVRTIRDQLKEKMVN